MGAAHSHEYLEICELDEEEYEEYEEGREKEEEEEDEFVDSRDNTFATSSSSGGHLRPKPPSSLDDVESKLGALKLKYPSTTQQQQAPPAKLFRYINGNTPKSQMDHSRKVHLLLVRQDLPSRRRRRRRRRRESRLGEGMVGSESREEQDPRKGLRRDAVEGVQRPAPCRFRR